MITIINPIVRLRFLTRYNALKIFIVRVVIKLTKKFFFSFTFFFNKILLRTGTKVNVNIKAPNKANPKVNASGENILPSTF